MIRIDEMNTAPVRQNDIFSKLKIGDYFEWPGRLGSCYQIVEEEGIAHYQRVR